MIQTNFPGLSLGGIANGNTVSVLTRVGLADGSLYSLEYNTYGQVKAIRRYAPNGANPQSFPGDYFERASTIYNLPVDNSTPQSDCPRFTLRTDVAFQHWAGGNWSVTTTFGPAAPNWSEGNVTSGDGTLYKEFFATTGWQRGLTTQTETWSGGVKKKWTTLQWTQDNTGVSYQFNPRVTEMNVYDDANNRRRTTINYTSFGLPSDVREYGDNATSVSRRTHTDYVADAAYIDRSLIGLPSARYLYDGDGNLYSKVNYEYDYGGEEYLVHQGPPVQHDTANYGPGFVTGRGNLSVTRQWDVTAPNDINRTKGIAMGYNTSGSVIYTQNGAGRRTKFSYMDSFSDSVNHNTFAYPIYFWMAMTGCGQRRQTIRRAPASIR